MYCVYEREWVNDDEPGQMELTDDEIERMYDYAYHMFTGKYIPDVRYLPDYIHKCTDALYRAERKLIHTAMLSTAAPIFNLSYRERLVNMVRAIPWEDGMLMAFSEVHVRCWYAGKPIDFIHEFEDNELGINYYIGVPGLDIRMSKLLYDVAREKMSTALRRRTMKHNVRYSLNRPDELERYPGNVSLCIHSVGQYMLYLNLEFSPYVQDGRMKLRLKCSMCGKTWGGKCIDLNVKPYANDAVVKALGKTKAEIERRVSGFARMLDRAPFNKPLDEV